MKFNFEKEPGKVLKKVDYNYDKKLISVIIPFYNDTKYTEQSVRSVLNQTYPCFELLIIDDGSTDKKSLKKLEEIKKLDDRIKVYHKENEGLAATRDYGAKKASKDTKYLFFLDNDDLIEPTCLECALWTLETNNKAAWTYTDSVGFDADEYTWNKCFNSRKLKQQNDLVATAMIRKDDFIEVGGYGLREKAVNEDWNFWLKMVAKGKFPVRMNFYGFWYRRKGADGELAKSRENKDRAMEIIKETAKTIKKDVEAIQYPRFEYNWDELVEEFEQIPKYKRKENGKTNILLIIPWMIMGGADRFNLSLIEKLDKKKFDITIITTEPAVNIYRQQFEEYATVYDLTTFLDNKYWTAFINYLIYKNNINVILNTNSEAGYSFIPYIKAKHPEVPIIDYVHMEEWYYRNGGYSRDSSGVSSMIDKTLTCNANSERILVEHFKRNKDEIQTVYIGVDEKKFDPENYDRKALREEYGIENKYVIGYICRITEQKRPYLFLRIIEELSKQRDDFEVIVAGNGNMLAEIKSKANNLGLRNIIKFEENVDEVQKIYSICDLTLNCSIKEGLALTSYESLSMGIPVVSCDVGGQKELINEDVGIIVPCMQDEEDILEFDYSDEEVNNYVEAVNKVIKNLKTLKGNCRKRILKGFTINQMQKNMAKILEDTSKNPNKEKIKNGKSISNTIDITKELITKYFEMAEIKYEWEITVYNKEFGLGRNNYKIKMLKEKMWKHKWYRGLIKFLQKIGLIKLIKKNEKINNIMND